MKARCEGIILWIALIVLVFSTGCAIKKAPALVVDPRQDVLDAQRSTFVISKAEDTDAWNRGQAFIGRYSHLKLQIVTEFVIETYGPGKDGCFNAYSVNKMPVNEGFSYSVKAYNNNFLCQRSAKQCTKILAHYIQTGELFEDMIK